MNVRRPNVSLLLCAALFACIALTGLTGYVQVRFDLHRFIFHKYLAYTSLILTGLHVVYNWKKVAGYIKALLRS